VASWSYGLGFLYVAPKWRESGIQMEQSWLTRFLADLTNYVAECAASSGYSVLPPEQRCSHMIGVRLPHGIPAGLSAAFERANSQPARRRAQDSASSL
jgi:hypothetical protein